ncbi:hypothetical protein F9278_15000 [Streptomyces phaeolivaceus]|uniref:Uncharacterized protein n=1 Tax=Streptomyces phaeolivaceus TaxID=2653200 RepID=A0A5P8K3W1_9ACTN|nr:hypothetical protein [Streptomyces phaeolivaceus]QFQ97297.1 hypothetical protein F9278_15000 [Streptomyces phaeolivaceus]
MDDRTTVLRDDQRLTFGRCGQQAYAGTLTDGHMVTQVFRHRRSEATAGHEVEPVWGEILHQCDFCDPDIQAI